MKYCPKCDNIMDVSRTAPKMTNSINPTTLSSTDTSTVVDVDNTTKIINMYLNNIDITGETGIDIAKLQKNPEFSKLKDKEKKELINIIKNIENETSNVFIVCKNCSYSEKLIKRTLVLNKMSKHITNEVIDQSKYKYMKELDVLPHTRDYICKNKSCQTHKDYKLRDAKWFRPIQDSYQTYYICCVCDTVWNIS